ncbi:Gfo/Idh/MocA family oxidoreductase [Priestia megaterium]|jgi:predicted dehydrogenase|uniref:NADH-dependent dehydrogenase n=4 Tax=Priestia TaxID=2800373 RepID=D5DR27_PRIM1|nr:MULTISPECIES: Gfo/Idh/MocA family oxidoreductase [Priestia]AVX08193.1 gfo/Idh/MocA family oxidoreductase [Bacillus sp. Y-01]KOP74360.1 dehydrogenase [Bacillus sp. FJAT-21351]KQU19984.1 dehydrogenase [Bacillus sp. Leaf75]KRF55640.1 dehydrogenase [Bacillus sp. Soil531]MBZ5480924.1 Gfo/Idh/MocA family oxidoreductase [Bacillus sp. T_4]MCF6796020.1 Gfo/Idh/MocA family oxidoreductase [Bacillus sp. ET1]MCJ7986397.1 Gfo/Idh/MocA family oxidoreductase [Priestia sp. OVL9]MDH6654861.1 putative dehy
MEKVKIGVIGCGSIAQHRHLPEYKMNEQVELVAVCDINTERANSVAQQYGVKAYTNYEELLASGTVEAVSVCTPNYLHAPISVAALNSGVHVLCEKPMATSEEEAKAMIEAAKTNGKKLMIGHNQRFVASHQKARELIGKGEIGKIYSFRTAFGHGGPEGWSVDGKDSWFFKKDEAFIGAMGDLGVHKTDMLRYILNEEIVEVGAFVESNAKDFANVDDNAVCVLKTESGIIGTLAASWAYNGKEDNSTIVYGEKGILRLEDDPTYSLVAQYATGEVVNYELGKIQSNDEGGQSNSHVIEQFVDAVAEDKESPVPGEEGLKSLAVILAALKSSQTKQITRV